MAKKKEENMEIVNGYVPKKTNKGLIIALVVIAALVMIASVVLPFVLVFVFAWWADAPMEFESVDASSINIPKMNINVSVDDTLYDEKEECFILSTKIEKTGESSKKTFFDYDNLTVTYIFKDREGFVVGNESLYLDNISKYDKWKQNVYYCGPNADEITTYEVESVESY